MQKTSRAQQSAAPPRGGDAADDTASADDLDYWEGFYADFRAPPVQRYGDGSPEAGADAHAIAEDGVAGSAAPLPHLGAIQRSFGAHDVTGVKAHVGGPARPAARALGASAYATGDRVAFADAPDVRTAAHEAAHVVQQRGGVQLDRGVGRAGDPYERHADAVADRVVRSESAEDLLGEVRGAPQVQRKAVQMAPPDADGAAPEMDTIQSQWEQEDEDPMPPAATALIRSKGNACILAMADCQVATAHALSASRAIAQYDLEGIEGAASRLDTSLTKIEGVIDSAEATIDDWEADAVVSVSGSRAIEETRSKIAQLESVLRGTKPAIRAMLSLPGQKTPERGARERSFATQVAALAGERAGDCAVANAAARDAGGHAEVDDPDAAATAARTLRANFMPADDRALTLYVVRRVQRSDVNHEVLWQLQKQLGIEIGGLDAALHIARAENPELLAAVESWDEAGDDGEQAEKYTEALRLFHEHAGDWVMVDVPTLPEMGKSALPRGFSRFIRAKQHFVEPPEGEPSSVTAMMVYDQWKLARRDLSSGIDAYAELDGHDASLVTRARADIEHIDAKLATARMVTAVEADANADDSGAASVDELLALREIKKAAANAEKVHRELVGKVADAADTALGFELPTGAASKAKLTEIFDNERLNVAGGVTLKTISAIAECANLDEALKAAGKNADKAGAETERRIALSKTAVKVLEAVHAFVEGSGKGFGAVCRHMAGLPVSKAISSRFLEYAAQSDKFVKFMGDKVGKVFGWANLVLAYAEWASAVVYGTTDQVIEKTHALATAAWSVGAQAAKVGGPGTVIGQVVLLEVLAAVEIYRKIGNIAKAGHKVKLREACKTIGKHGASMTRHGKLVAGASKLLGTIDTGDELDRELADKTADKLAREAKKCLNAMGKVANAIHGKTTSKMRDAFEAHADTSGLEDLGHRLGREKTPTMAFYGSVGELKDVLQSFNDGLKEFAVEAQIEFGALTENQGEFHKRRLFNERWKRDHAD